MFIFEVCFLSYFAKLSVGKGSCLVFCFFLVRLGLSWQQSLQTAEKEEFNARFIRRVLVASNAIQTIDNEISHLIIHCLKRIRCDQNSTY